ncbi:MAG: hypothetical protein NT094_03920 [Candidatus Staskawiczbacteria bacterium]|nr:hypothetical protein [Candidatus Staskawiczbacteria bacterium]
MNDNTNWAIRHAIYDMIETNLLSVPNKKQILNFIKDDISNENLFKLYTMMENEVLEMRAGAFLKECYYNHLAQNNDLSIFNESNILEKRDQVLMEAEGKESPAKVGMTPDDIVLLAKRIGGPATALYLAKMYFIGTPSERKRLKNAVAKLSSIYDKTIKNLFLRNILNPSKNIKSLMKEKEKEGYLSGIGNVLRQTGQNVKTAAQTFNLKHSKGLGTLRKYTGITAGITAAVAGSYLAYKNYMENKKAREFCTKFKGKQNTICMLKFKIQASDAAIEKLQQAKSGCTQKSDPEKCIYGLNRELWKWQN